MVGRAGAVAFCIKHNALESQPLRPKVIRCYTRGIMICVLLFPCVVFPKRRKPGNNVFITGFLYLWLRAPISEGRVVWFYLSV